MRPVLTRNPVQVERSSPGNVAPWSEAGWAGFDAVANFGELLFAVIQQLPPGFEPPGCAGIAQGADLCVRVIGVPWRGLALDDEVESFTGPAMFTQPRHHRADVIRLDVARLAVTNHIRQDSVAAQNASHRFVARPRADDPDRDVVLNRLCDVGEIGPSREIHLVMLSGIDALALPEPLDEIDALVHHRRPSLA